MAFNVPLGDDLKLNWLFRLSKHQNNGTKTMIKARRLLLSNSSSARFLLILPKEKNKKNIALCVPSPSVSYSTLGLPCHPRKQKENEMDVSTSPTRGCHKINKILTAENAGFEFCFVLRKQYVPLPRVNFPLQPFACMNREINLLSWAGMQSSRRKVRFDDFDKFHCLRAFQKVPEFILINFPIESTDARKFHRLPPSETRAQSERF